MTDQELHAALAAQGWRTEFNGGGTHIMRKGALVLSGVDGDLPSLHWYCLTVSPQWDSQPDAAPVHSFTDASAEWQDSQPRDLWADIREATAIANRKIDPCKAQFRYFRNRVELSDSPAIRDIESAGHRLGKHSRADASRALRDYIWRKQCAIVRHIAARDPWRPIVNHGRELPLAMLREG